MINFFMVFSAVFISLNINPNMPIRLSVVGYIVMVVAFIYDVYFEFFISDEEEE